MSNPPGLDRVSTPSPARRVAYAPMSASEYSQVLAVICTPNARVSSRANTSQTPRKRLELLDDHSRQRVGHHHDQNRAVLDGVKALAALDPAGCGLDGASAQLESRTYVMADEARPHFCVDAAHVRSYREDLVGASRTPSQSRQTRSAVANALRAKL